MQKRQITPLETRVVSVPSHILTFDIFGIPYAEPAFASIAELSSDELATADGTGDHQRHLNIPPVHGVAYLLTGQDYRRLVLSEGSGVGYDEIEVKAFSIPEANQATTNCFIALTLKAKYPFRPNRVPSHRYMVRLGLSEKTKFLAANKLVVSFDRRSQRKQTPRILHRLS